MESLRGQMLRTSLWNLHLRIPQLPQDTPGLRDLEDRLDSAARKLSDPTNPCGPAMFAADPPDVSVLTRNERAVCALAVKLNKQSTGQLHAEHAEDLEQLEKAFLLTDEFAEIERMLRDGSL